jgi:hypothetical protein
MQTKRITSCLAPCAVGALLSACGSLGSSDGGGSGLPNRGIAGYQLVEEPVEASGEGSGEGSGESTSSVVKPLWILNDDEDFRYSEPSALYFDGTIEMLVGRRKDDEYVIVWVRSNDGGDTFSAPVVVLQGSDLPEAFAAEGEIAAPSLQRDTNGWVVAFEYGGGAGIGLARGATLDALVIDGEPLLVPTEPYESDGVTAPSLVVDGAAATLYYVTEGEVAVEGSGDVAVGPAIAMASIDAAGALNRLGVVLDGTICGDPPAEDCLEGEEVSSPEVRLATTPTGSTVYRMFYSAGDDGTEAIVFAASYDGRIWSRFPFNPVLNESRFDEFGATNLRIGDEYVLFYTRVPNRGTRGIVRAINSLGNAADRW